MALTDNSVRLVNQLSSSYFAKLSTSDIIMSCDLASSVHFLNLNANAFMFGLDVGGTAKVEGYPGNSSSLNNIVMTGCTKAAILISAALDNSMSQVEFVQKSPITLSCFCGVYQ